MPHHLPQRIDPHVTLPDNRTDPASLGDSDRALMARVIEGSEQSFGQLYDRYCDRAYRVARVVCQDDGRAQDAVQDGFLCVWKSRASYRPEQGTVAAWLLTVIRYRAIDIARSHSKHAARRASDDQLVGHSAVDDPLAIVIKRDDAQRLQQSLAMLPETQAEVIALAYYGQLSHAEIAAQLGLCAGTVKGRMRLGLHKLRADIKDSTPNHHLRAVR
jgi:RNA polymerase sigma-70 factor (ECF subfamily)